MTTDARGCFISLEGGEGVGKSTQVRALAAALRARGIEVVETREPGGSDNAEAIRALLFARDWEPAAEALLFAAARADHVSRIIRPAVERGAWVLSDRFVDSSRAYQGEGLGLGDAAILSLHGLGSGGMMPDRTLVLSLPLFDASLREFARDSGQLDRFGRRDGDYHQRLHAFFETLAVYEPDRIRRVDAEGAPEIVTQRMLAAIGDLL